MSRSKPVVFKGQSFPSVKALMTHLEISKSAYYLRLSRGLAPDAVIPRSGFSKRVPVELDGVRYPSISAYARAAGLGRATAKHRVMTSPLTTRAAEVRPAGGQMNDRAVISYHLNI